MSVSTSRRTCNHCTPPSPCFLCRLPTRERAAVAEIVRWLRTTKPWQLFGTFTFCWNVSGETANRIFKEFIDFLEMRYRANICVVYGRESKARRYGMNVPHHFHVAMTSLATLTPETVSRMWLAVVAKHTGGRYGQNSAKVDFFDDHKRGLEYCFKAINEGQSDWGTWNLDLFLRNHPGPERPNHRKLRRLKRAALQTNRFPVH